MPVRHRTECAAMSDFAYAKLFGLAIAGLFAATLLLNAVVYG